MEYRMIYSKSEAVITTIVLLLVACMVSGFTLPKFFGSNSEDKTMKQSVTYLHLLRHTPFFTQLDKEQLRWVINHSKEWEAQPGTVISVCGSKSSAGEIWILLDGGWQVETNGNIYPAGHADPGKWFTPAVTNKDCRLVTNQRSYVMRIERSDMDEMLANGFSFKNHMEEGKHYYQGILAN